MPRRLMRRLLFALIVCRVRKLSLVLVVMLCLASRLDSRLAFRLAHSLAYRLATTLFPEPLRCVSAPSEQRRGCGCGAAAHGANLEGRRWRW